jgi:polysaccharide biosynthesis protein VpsQ
MKCEMKFLIDIQLKRWLPFLIFLLLIIGIIIINDLGQLRNIMGLVNSVPFGDKFGHIILIGTLTYLLNYALTDRLLKFGNRKILLGCLIIAVIMTIEECSQLWILTRTFDLIDLSANYLGISIAGWLRLRP